MNNSFKADEITISKIIEYYKQYQIEDDKYLFKAKSDSFSIIIYNNKTVLFQGNRALDELSIWTEIESYDNNINHIGSDEVGCGDYFGPIVVCAAYVKKEDVEYLKSINVQDSKKISDETIVKIADKIKKRIKYASFVLSNEKYNEITNQKYYNMNKIKAYLHNFVLFNLSKKTKFNDLIVVDQFCDEKLYYQYLNDFPNNEIVDNISFTTKAESKYLAVACASIIARDIFLKEIDKMSKETGKNILLGANEKVDELARNILEEKGFDYLAKYVKVNFKNTHKIQSLNI